MKSVWSETEARPHFEALKKDIKTDVLIIGGGIAGILTAYMLKKSGVDCVIVEADKICAGVTNYTTAKITFQHGLIYDKLISRFGTEYAKMYLEANRAAIKQYSKMCRDIECDHEITSAFVYLNEDKGILDAELSAYDKLGIKAMLRSTTELPINVAGALEVKGQAQFNPLKFAFSIAKDLQVYENTKVLEIKKGSAVTDKHTIFAEKIVVATHFPFINKYGAYFLKLYQSRSYVIALKNAQKLNGMYVDGSDKGLSFRRYKDMLLLGGGGHRTGKKGGNWQELRDFAKRYYPNSEEICFFATQDCMSLDDVPYIGQYSKRIPWVYVATGFNKWGMTSSMVSAMILTDKILGKSNPYQKVFDPSRSMWRPQLFVNIAESTLGLITPTVPRCPHLGCALKYNKQEHSYDCPCHGSRFTEEGKLINNPATKDKNM